MRKALVLLAVLAALPLLAAPASAEPTSEQWETRFAPGRTPSTGHTFSLFNAFNDREVRYGAREHGINLVWSPGTTREWSLRRRDGAVAPLARNARYALYNVTNRAWVRYGERDTGINLVWSSTPAYEWAFVDFSDPATPVPAGARDALHNAVAGDYLIYGHRNCGINLVWFTDGIQMQTPWGAIAGC
ncbi:MAG TPA: hypothetical protein VD931_03790 [Baekduia sp.]|nr:hypothetical protein [Baekduia sp.]